MRGRARPILILLVLLLLVGAAGVDAYEGAAGLFRLGRVTVVYPSGPGEDVERNRLSAERRAAYLRAEHRMVVSVASDGDIDDERLRGNLLLLGWGNRLLHPKGKPGVLRQLDAGRQFLDGIPLAAGRDLLFLHSSPYARTSTLVFWSRIEPELDRFLVVPFLGSDWAVFRDLSIESLGNFDNNAWPPRRNLAAEKFHVPPSTPLQRSSEHYDLHHRPGLLDEEDTGRVLAAREKAYAAAVGRLGLAPAEGFRIRLYVYLDEEQKEDQCDVSDPAHIIGRNRELHMVRRLALSAGPHEDIHLIAREVLGPSYLTVMYEGLASSIDSATAEADLSAAASMILEHAELPSLEALFDEEELRRLTRRNLGFPASALLVDWLRATTDAGTFRRVYSMPSGGREELAALLGRPGEEVESAFRDWVTSRAKSGDVEVGYRTAMARARERSRIDDHEGEMVALEEALKIRPDAPGALYWLGMGQLRRGDTPAAEGTFDRLAAQTGLPPADAHYAIFARYQLGRIYGKRGERERAEGSYRSILELPDRKGSHRLARQALENGGEGGERRP